MYNNQYFISSDIIRKPNDFKELSTEDINIYYQSYLSFIYAINDKVKIYLLGYIIDPFSPYATNQDIINNISETCNTLNLFFKYVQNLSGRFVILYKNDYEFVAMNDACALRQLYYNIDGNKVILTSSEKMFLDLFGFDLVASPGKIELMRSENFRNNDNTWFGDKNYDDRLKKLLPNHYFDLRNKVALRTPIFIPDIKGEDNVISYIAKILEGSMNAITSRYKVYHALTAGWDSRVILSASRGHKDTIQYYIFDYSKKHQNIVFWNDSDKYIPQRLSQKFGFNFTICETEELRKDFLEMYNKEHVNPRILPKTAEIQYFYDMGGNYQEKIRLTGIGGEVGRCRFGFTKRKINNRMLYYFSGYGDKFKFIMEEIDNWMETAIEYSNEYCIPLLDLFYWEIKMANWGAQYLFEQDIAIEEFWPLSNKNIFLCLFKIPAHRRSLPGCKVHRNLIQYLWPEILCEPINPLGRRAYIQMMLGRYSTLRYYKARYHL